MDKQETLKQAQLIKQLKATDVVRNDYVRQQFINVYNAIWREDGELVYNREALYFNQKLRENQALRGCTGMSVFLAFIDLAVRGLTLEPSSQPLCYLLSRKHKITTPQGEQWETRCELTISGYGELVLRARAGQIQHADNPVIVYEGDDFSFGEKDGHKYVNYCCRIPRTSNKIIACFIKITRCDGTVDYSVMTENDWKRLESYSAKNNSYYDVEKKQRVERANVLYNVQGQIDPGFLAAKCIKHAFKTYPKIAIGKGTQLESEVAGMPEQEFDVYGGIAGDEPKEEPEKRDFAPDTDMAGGIKFEPSPDNEDDNVDDVF